MMRIWVLPSLHPARRLNPTVRKLAVVLGE